jgi:hypothetical protein
MYGLIGHSAHVEELRNSDKILIGKHQGKRRLGDLEADAMLM